MASSSNEQDLLPDQTEGFKVGEKKTMDEYHKLGMWLSHFHCYFILSMFLSSGSFVIWSSFIRKPQHQGNRMLSNTNHVSNP
jgi:hypothetical protein